MGNETLFSPRRGPNRCPSPSTENAGTPVIGRIAALPQTFAPLRPLAGGHCLGSKSPAGHHAPRPPANRNRFDHLTPADLDHREALTDPVRRLDPALIPVG